MLQGPFSVIFKEFKFSIEYSIVPWVPIRVCDTASLPALDEPHNNFVFCMLQVRFVIGQPTTKEEYAAGLQLLQVKMSATIHNWLPFN